MAWLKMVDGTWAALRKRSLMSRVIVVPKEGRVRVAAPALLFVGHQKKGQKKGHASLFWFDNDSGHYSIRDIFAQCSPHG